MGSPRWRERQWWQDERHSQSPMAPSGLECHHMTHMPSHLQGLSNFRSWNSTMQGMKTGHFCLDPLVWRGKSSKRQWEGLQNRSSQMVVRPDHVKSWEEKSKARRLLFSGSFILSFMPHLLESLPKCHFYSTITTLVKTVSTLTPTLRL